MSFLLKTNQFKRQFTTLARQLNKMEYLVIVFDKPGSVCIPTTDCGGLQDRSQIRAKHVANIPNAVANHGVTNVGAIYKDESKTEFAGSAYNIKANSKEEIMEFLKSDPYVEAGIWDLSNVQIWPYGCAGRLPVDVVGTKK
ncbi:unnamed protein product [Ambrosiozyma monospora]|uniref:Unnamed protein product n=1 Tax=Ambrosiozyma monospora TaxID=43982 RepID=A0A9W7DCG0_AMBMO|nr:unnamed protein product [Ambrosiozyma monospora]